METSNFPTGREGAEAEAPAREGKRAHTLGGDSLKLLTSVPSEAPLPHWGISSGVHHRLLQQPAWTSFQAPPTGNHLGGDGHGVDNGARLPKGRWDLKAPCPAAMPAESPSGRCPPGNPPSCQHRAPWPSTHTAPPLLREAELFCRRKTRAPRSTAGCVCSSVAFRGWKRDTGPICRRDAEKRKSSKGRDRCTGKLPCPRSVGWCSFCPAPALHRREAESPPQPGL